MKLIEAVEKLYELDEDATICVLRPWEGDAECTVVMLDGDSTVPKATTAAGFEYFLEVDVCLEVLEVFGTHKPTTDQKLRVLIYYAENDAWPDWVNEVRR